MSDLCVYMGWKIQLPSQQVRETVKSVWSWGSYITSQDAGSQTERNGGLEVFSRVPAFEGNGLIEVAIQ